MMVTRLPEQRLVYLHCSSIFTGANAQIRRLKKITQILSQHRKSIKILTNEFPLDAIAAVAKRLLDEQIFEARARAQLRFPELFQPSETQEAERDASEAEVARTEAETVQKTVVTSDEEWEEELLDTKCSQQEGVLPDAGPSIADQIAQAFPAELR